MDTVINEFARGVEAYRRRHGYKTTRQAVLEIGKQAGYKRPDKLFRYMNGKERPGRDRALLLAEIVKRRPEKCWPPKREA